MVDWCCRRPHIYEHFFRSLSAQSRQCRDKKKPEAEIMLYYFFEWLQGLFIVYGIIGSTVHSMPLNSLEHACDQTIAQQTRDVDPMLMSVQRLRRFPNIKSTLGQRLVFAGFSSSPERIRFWWEFTGLNMLNPTCDKRNSKIIITHTPQNASQQSVQVDIISLPPPPPPPTHTQSENTYLLL